MATHRQLAAILFTDIEGYTARMQEDEPAALQLKNRHREILDREHQRFEGRIIQYYGDGTMSIFPSVVQAVQCALTMQLQFREAPPVPVRMGLHLGDILVQDGDVFGDGVNIAARIESLGVSGSVLLSDKVVDELRNHPAFNTRSVGIYQFKNVQREIEVYALNHEGLIVPAPDSLSGKTVEKKLQAADAQAAFTETKNQDHSLKSIAILPFVNMSNDPEQEYFSDGMAEEILNALTSLKDLKIAGRTSSFQFKGKNVDLRTIGEQLGVRTVLEGSVRKQGNRLRITAQLINVEDGFHLWSERYERGVDDLFAIQDEIAWAITDKLKVTLMGEEAKLITRNYIPKREAYELYLKGRFYINRRGAAIIQGLKYLQEAVAADPEFALAHAGLADASLLLAFYGIVPPSSIMSQGKSAAERALQLDPTLSEPYCSLGFYYACSEWNWEKAEASFRKAIELNPRYPQAHSWYGFILLAWVKGEFDKAEEHGLIALNLEPLSAISHANYGAILHAAGKYEQSLACCEAGLELDANSFLCLIYKGNALAALKRYEEALSTYEAALKLSNRHPFALNALIMTRCRMGDMDEARKLMEELKFRSSKEYIPGTFTAMSAANLGEREEAYAFLEKAFMEKDSILLTLKNEHWIPPAFKAEERFQQLMAKIGFPPHERAEVG
jgi:TolB-like protein/class 3 adenylate cyclase/Tfp pilus assembly protein PilF